MFYKIVNHINTTHCDPIQIQTNLKKKKKNSNSIKVIPKFDEIPNDVRKKFDDLGTHKFAWKSGT